MAGEIFLCPEPGFFKIKSLTHGQARVSDNFYYGAVCPKGGAFPHIYAA